MIEHVQVDVRRTVRGVAAQGRSRNAMRPGNGQAFSFSDDSANRSRVSCRMSGSLPTQAPLHLPIW